MLGPWLEYGCVIFGCEGPNLYLTPAGRFLALTGVM
jgi:hypothetical protein